MIGMFVVAIVLSASDAGQPNAPAHVVPVAAMAVSQHAVAKSPDMTGWDPDKPSAAWLSKMVRPCAKSGNRLVC